MCVKCQSFHAKGFCPEAQKLEPSYKTLANHSFPRWEWKGQERVDFTLLRQC